LRDRAATEGGHDGAQIILFVQHALPTGYDPDYFKTPRQGVHIELELILE